MGILIIIGIVIFIITIMVKPDKNTKNTSQRISTNFSNKFNKGNCDVILETICSNKILLFKEVRDVLHCSLVEAKDIIDSVPSTLVSKVSEYDAYTIKNKLENIGVKVKISYPNNNFEDVSNNKDNQKFGNCNIILVYAGEDKIRLLKEIKDILNCGLVEAKDIIDSVPSTLVSNISEHDAYRIKNELENIGAKVKISYTDILNIVSNENSQGIVENNNCTTIEVIFDDNGDDVDDIDDIGDIDEKEIFINEQSCRFCGECATICPQNAIDDGVDGYPANIDYSRCNECLKCLNVCKYGAITYE